jgi:carbon-monoxide dehydrogenase catalytic subunit
MTEEIRKKTIKLADPETASIDIATQQMIKRAQDLEIDTVFDRAASMKPCNIGLQGICCKVCAMGPCRLPLPKGGIEGKDTRKGLCGATANTIAARNFARMVAAGTAAHSDHGRTVAEIFLSVARKETQDYKIKDPLRLLQIAPCFDVATTVEVDGEVKDRDLDEIALEVAEKAIAEWGKPEGHLYYLKRAPEPLQEKWKKNGVEPRSIDREVVDIMHRTTMGVDQDYVNINKQ